MGNPLLELPTVAQKSVDFKGRHQKTSIEQRRDKPTLHLFYYFSFFEDIFRDRRTLRACVLQFGALGKIVTRNDEQSTFQW